MVQRRIQGRIQETRPRVSVGFIPECLFNVRVGRNFGGIEVLR